jgi:predicted Zn-dependent peptidase
VPRFLFPLLLLTLSASAEVRLVQKELPNGVRLVLAPDVVTTKVAIHATFDGPKVAANRFRADANDDRALLATEVDPADVPKTLQQLAKAIDGRTNTVVAIAGPVNERLVIASLGKIDVQRNRDRCETTGILPRRELDGRQLDLTFPTPPSPTADWYALNVLADVLGQGPQSRLQSALVGKGLATQFLEGMTESPCASALRMRVVVAPGIEIATVRERLDTELARLGRELISAEELRTAHAQERKWAEEQLSTPAGIASAAARTALFYGDALRLHNDVARMEAVTAEDVRRVAQEYLVRRTAWSSLRKTPQTPR